MSDLHRYLQHYVQDLQQLLAEASDAQQLLDKAEVLWGANDYRYLVVEQAIRSPNYSKFCEPASKPPKPTPVPGEDNKPQT